MRPLFTIALGVMASFCHAQNMVPNPGFEYINACPTPYTFLKNVKEWKRVKNHEGTPEHFYGDCWYNGQDNVKLGNRDAHGGSGYAGQFIYGSETREYITVRLKQPMEKDTIYDVEFWVIAGGGFGTLCASYGAHFSENELSGNGNWKHIPAVIHVGLNPRLENPYPINWTKVRGKYKSRGGERYLTFGNFYSDGASTSMPLIGDYFIENERSFMLLDDVKVVKESRTAFVRQKEVRDSIVQATQVSYNIPVKFIKPYKDNTPKAIRNTTSQDYIHYKSEQLSFQKHRKDPAVNLSVTMWDPAGQDGDKITVKIDGELVIADYETNKTREVRVLNLGPGRHHIQVISVNEGKYSPNTARIKFKYRRQKFLLYAHDKAGGVLDVYITVE